MSDNRRCFVQYFVLVLGYAVIAFFATWYGLSQIIWKTDITYMTSIIAGIVVVMIGYIGMASWRIGGKHHRYLASGSVADANLGRMASDVVIRFGLLGTVIGLLYQVQAMASVTPDHISQFLGQVSSALGTAFFATGAGIVGSIAISGIVANLDYFIEYDDVEAE